MSNWTGIEFVRDNLGAEHVTGKSVLEVGALDVNGSVRPTLEALGPASYVGVDISPGSGVDEVCDVHEIVSRFGRESLDVVVASELVEHVRDWRGAFENMKRVLRPAGTIVVTTRSKVLQGPRLPVRLLALRAGGHARDLCGLRERHDRHGQDCARCVRDRDQATVVDAG